MRGGNTLRQAYSPTLGVTNIVTRSDMDAAEYMAADWMIASKTRRYLTKLKTAHECSLQWLCASELLELNTRHMMRPASWWRSAWLALTILRIRHRMHSPDERALVKNEIG